MAKKRMREVVSEFPGPDYLRAKQEGGWRLVALEWEREAEDTERAPREEVPFGLKVADDCVHLEEDPDERQALRLMLDLIVDDEIPLSRVSNELNRKGFWLGEEDVFGNDDVWWRRIRPPNQATGR